MKFLKSVLAGFALSAFAFNAFAVPAKPGLIPVTQPDGTTLNIKLIGDEFMHFTTAEDGTLIKEGDDGFFYLAELNHDGFVVATGSRVDAVSPSVKKTNISELDFVKLAKIYNVEERRAQRYFTHDSQAAVKPMSAPAVQKAPQTGMGLTGTAYPRTGSPKGLIILVEYSDVKFNSSYNAKQYFNDMINGKNFTQYGGTGSAIEYFTEQSNGKFTPSFDVLGPVTLPNPMSYYGANDKYGQDANAYQMIVHAVQILDPTVDFSQYDTNKDGMVDNVFVFYAGRGEASGGSADSVWPHSWNMSQVVNLRADNVRFGQYACSNEWTGSRPDGIGTFVHEFSHVMGLPDLYTTDYNGAARAMTPGEYNVLDQGPYNNSGCTPPNYSAFELNALGWFEPTIITEAASISLDNITSGQFVLIPTEKSTEFYLFENRQLEGWDKFIPYHGMLIWHIDYVASVFNSNQVNNTGNHQYVDIVEAGGVANNNSKATMRQYPFPGQLNRTEFTAATTPAFVSWAGRGIDLPITSIKETNGIITFDVAGGGSLLATPAASVETPNASDTYFVAKWNAVPGATDYLLTVVANDGKPSGTMTNGFEKSTMPDGWSLSGTATYDNTGGNYGSGAPSLKMAKDLVLTSPQTQSNINSVSFWMKGGGGLVSGTLVVEGYTNGSWSQLYSKQVPSMAAGQTDEITNIPAGTTQVRFKATNAAILIDDIEIKYGGVEEILPDYNRVSTNGATTYRVDKLKANHPYYYFTVVATDGSQESRASNPVSVTLVGMAGIEDVTVDNDINSPVEYFSLQGAKILSPAPGSVVIERKGSSVRKVIVK